MLILIQFMILCRSFAVIAYSNKLFTIARPRETHNEDICSNMKSNLKVNETNQYYYVYGKFEQVTSSGNTNPMIEMKNKEEDPMVNFHDVIYKFLFGENYGPILDVTQKIKNDTQVWSGPKTSNLLHYPTGRALRKAELFNGNSSVHLPIEELMHVGHCKLNLTGDYMQTAVDAFNIFANGDLADIERLPPDYVLDSSRTISMLKISHEKLAATWNVVKGSKDHIEVTYETLEKYRPLFKYLSGKDMAELNLKDPRILKYIGTHPDLTRHQAGLVASKYIKINSRWSDPQYLNSMNNLLCGVPITYMRDIPENTYLQLSHQVFYHTRACDPLQRRFYLSMMTRTQALGKSYSWNAQDVARLGLLLAEVEGEDLGAIKPEALAGLTAQVVMAMRPANLLHLTDIQLQYIGKKAFNVLSKKLISYKDQFLSTAVQHVPVLCIVFLNIIISSCLANYMYSLCALSILSTLKLCHGIHGY